MQRQLCIKLLSKFPQNANPISQNSVLSSLLKTKANPLVRHAFSPYSTLSQIQSSKIYSHDGVLGKIQNGFFTISVPARMYFSSALLKGQSKCSINDRVWVQFKRNFHSFDSQYRGWRSVFRRFTADGVVLGLIVTNVAVFLLWRVADPQFMVQNFMISVDNIRNGRMHTLITCAFSHNDMSHLISNMVGLYFFGSSMGNYFGPQYLLKLYLSGALVGSIFYLAYHVFIAQPYQGNNMRFIDPSRIPGLGASGALNAIMLLDIFLFPKNPILFNFFIPIPAILMGIFIIGNDIYKMLEGDRQVSGSAHLGGTAVAALAWLQIKKGRFKRF